MGPAALVSAVWSRSYRGSGQVMPRRRQRDESRAGQGLLAGQEDAEEHRNRCSGSVREGKDQKWEVVTSLSVSLVKITTEPLHTVGGQALPVVLGPASHLEESRLCCGLGVLHPYRPSWPSSTAAGSGIQLCLHPSLLQLL